MCTSRYTCIRTQVNVNVRIHIVVNRAAHELQADGGVEGVQGCSEERVGRGATCKGGVGEGRRGQRIRTHQARTHVYTSIDDNIVCVGA